MTTRTGWTRGLIRAVALLVCAAGVATSRAGSAGYHRIPIPARPSCPGQSWR